MAVGTERVNTHGSVMLDICNYSLHSSDSALADHCARLQVIFTYLLTYITLLAGPVSTES